MGWNPFSGVEEDFKKGVRVIEETADITFAITIFISMLIIGLLWANKRAVITAAVLL